MVAVAHRGEVWTANLNPSRGVGKIRPVLIMQDDRLIASGTPLVVVLPMTTRVYPDFRRWRITVPARERLLKDCQIVVDQPRALDRRRLGDGPLTRLTSDELGQVEASLKAVMGLW